MFGGNPVGRWDTGDSWWRIWMTLGWLGATSFEPSGEDGRLYALTDFWADVAE